MIIGFDTSTINIKNYTDGPNAITNISLRDLHLCTFKMCMVTLPLTLIKRPKLGVLNVQMCKCANVQDIIRF